MKKAIYFQPLYFLFWVLFFIVSRAAFLLYNLDNSSELTTADLAGTFLYGSRLDFSFASYLSALPFIIAFVGIVWKRLPAAGIIRWYTFVLLGIMSVLLAADLELYKHWGFRLDSTPLQYLNTPTEMMASTGSAPILLLSFVALALTGIFALIYKLYFDLRNYRSGHSSWVTAVLSFIFIALLILPMRGGVQQIPINQSTAYFSDRPFTNHASLNMPWNMLHSILKYGEQSKNPYLYLPADSAAHKVQQLYAAVSDSSQQLVKPGKPNVLLIILESYTAKMVEHLGGEKGITPNLDRLAKEGVTFTNFYASGDRSQKGMVSILSGYPVQPATSIVKVPKKSEKLPQLSHTFEQHGYKTSFYYGGELEFANLKSYFVNGGYDKLIDKYAFPEESYNSKWGAHDHVLFERVLKDLKSEKEPFFSTVYTLSSHEPFEIPIKPKFPVTDEISKFRNSVYYTDWALGNFISVAKKEPWWQHTLLVLVADHGHPYPNNDPNHVPSKFHIPFILTGGALTTHGQTIDMLGSQTDIAATILSQLHLPHNEYVWSRNLLAATTNPFAFYVFQDGFGYLTPAGAVTFDNTSKKVITNDEAVTEEQLEMGKAYLQYSFDDFLKK
ncbi:sulfatase-like hydrolase/transferase [Pontibacter sp. BT310]|uniref:Sulfatase-like hydrolase/transferase n=1 Tax=Pontibacter populi TaxID=890055 RepID=A0ABS6XFU6_9BACT|nr:alkaline phosphatase family protein [Pontibacter populi]MBJ6120001.1 sulfatase-like hydrolase/transferase [Pontibacter sp. BT310]MBR0572430.1 sulfatase-like hydrolase/transferase [Microvirga sp. STS03]MBW3366854.1 sulfatase-like hydrolase/transferase [Pontibacter populi]